MAQGRGNAVGVLFVASLLAFAHTVVGVDHVIGGTNKWDYPPGTDTNYYATWSAKHNFVVGDSAGEYLSFFLFSFMDSFWSLLDQSKCDMYLNRFSALVSQCSTTWQPSIMCKSWLPTSTGVAPRVMARHTWLGRIASLLLRRESTTSSAASSATAKWAWRLW